MKLGGIGVPELLIILAVALLIFGPKNLPKLGASLGKTVKNLREGMSGAKETAEIEEAEDVAETEETVEEATPVKASAPAKKAKRKAAAPVA